MCAPNGLSFESPIDGPDSGALQNFFGAALRVPGLERLSSHRSRWSCRSGAVQGQAGPNKKA